MLTPRKPSMPTPDMEDELLADPPAAMIPARNAKEMQGITQELLMRMQSASPEEKAQIAELLMRVNDEADPTKPGADPTMTEPFVQALMQLPPEQRAEYMQMAGGLSSLGMEDPMAAIPDEEELEPMDRFEPAGSGAMPNQMPPSLNQADMPMGEPGSMGNQIPAYMARQQDMPPMTQGMDLMALLADQGPPQPMNMGSNQRFLSGLMG